MANPIERLNLWLKNERDAGAPNPQQAILSTATEKSIPHARVVAIREINEHDFVFFTQKGTRKVSELLTNPYACLTFWFELQQREVIIEGIAERLLPEENDHYWQSYPREAQIRFYSYAATSSQPISSKQVLEEKKKSITASYHNKVLPISEFYCGFRVVPTRMIFYAYRVDELSDVIEYRWLDNVWTKIVLSP